MKRMLNLRSGRPWRMVLLLAGAMFVLSLFTVAYANIPQEMKLSYNIREQVLTVKITHASTSPTTHFIKEIVVSNNGKVVKKTSYKSQPGDTFTYTYPLPSKGLGLIEVIAVCSVEGERTEGIIPFK
jgi:hypothetical protein